MPLKPVQSALILALLATPVLQGCNHSNPTEQELIQRAKDYEDKGNIKASVIELKNALKKNPNSPLARLLLGQIYLKANMGAEAEIELKKAQKLGVNRESITPQLGEALLLMGDYKRVLDEIKPSEQTSKPNLARIYQIRGEALLKTGKLQDACSLFQQSLNTDTNYPPTYWGLAQCAVTDNNMSKAKAWLDTALKINDKRAKSWIFMGDWDQMNNNPQAALVAYSNAIKSDPNSLIALNNRASLNIALGQLEAAKVDVGKISKLAPKSLLAEYTQALLAFKQKQYPQARDALQNVFQINPDHMPSVLLAGVTAYVLGSYQQAQSYLSRYLVNFPNQAYVRRVLAATLIKQNQPNKALETLAPLLTPDSKDAQALALAGEAKFMTKDSAQATKFLDRAITLDPKNASIHGQLGMNYLIMGDTLGAVNELETATALDPGQYQVNSLLVASLLQRKEYDKALAVIDAMEKKIPNSPITFNLRGKAYMGKQDWGNARKNFTQALAIAPAFFPAAASLAQLDLRDNKPDAARKRIEAILEKDKNNVQAMMALAELAAVQKQDQEYVRWLERARKAQPNAILPRVKLTEYYLAKKDKVKALNVAHETLTAYPDSPEAFVLLGTTQLAVGDKADALKTFTQLVEKAPSAPASYLQLALAQSAVKKLTAARASLNKALELQPDFRRAQELLIRLDMAENKGSDALKIARQIQAQQPTSPVGYDWEADILMAQKQYVQAIKAYEQALAKGASSDGLLKLYRAQVIAGDKNSAEQRLTMWIRQHPNDLVVREYAAGTYMLSGRNREAISQYEEILRSAPQNVVALNNLATLYQLVQDPRALALAEQALKLAPEQPGVMDTLGWILVQQGQLPRGLELLSKAAAKAPGAAVVRYHYGVALAHSGRNSDAKKELEAAIATGQKFPGLEEAKSLLNSL
ncbi:MAG: XrtA/PEP-CTERM system TPR-repeat protein PrsT [Burkholderiales bacterium]